MMASARWARSSLADRLRPPAVPNSIWDKPGPLTRAEFDRVELHPMLTEQMLRRSLALAVLNPVAAAHHEKTNGSGYH
jgi:HD-GYP domain-containing protein (c-di-GMP phosphodiesterase class II)